jgi:hypothetical protein
MFVEQGAYPREQSYKRALALLTNISQGQKRIAVTNTLGFYDRESVMAVKSFIMQAPVLIIFGSKKENKTAEKASVYHYIKPF